MAATTAVPAANGAAAADVSTSETEQCVKCEECGAGVPKYRCPGCSIRTCCLECVKGHKARSGCSGKRKAEYVAVKEFDDQQLMADYRFLEEALRTRDAATRGRPPAPPTPQWLPKHLHALQRSARQRNIHLSYMQPGMTRRTHNSTRWCSQAKGIQWHTEWKFVAAGASKALPRVPEARILRDALSAVVATPPAGPHERPPFRPAAALASPLRPYAEALEAGGGEGLTVLMRKEHCPANSPLYYRIDASKPLGEVLAGKAVVEYPVFLVLLPGQPLDAYPLAGTVTAQPAAASSLPAPAAAAAAAAAAPAAAPGAGAGAGRGSEAVLHGRAAATFGVGAPRPAVGVVRGAGAASVAGTSGRDGAQQAGGSVVATAAGAGGSGHGGGSAAARSGGGGGSGTAATVAPPAVAASASAGDGMLEPDDASQAVAGMGLDLIAGYDDSD